MGKTWRFIHIPKNGGCSFRKAYGRGSEKGHPHNPASQFPDVHKVAIIRNPYDRIVSVFTYERLMKVGNLAGPTKFREWLFGDRESMWANNKKYGYSLRIAEPQVKWLTDDVWLLRFWNIKDDAIDWAIKFHIDCVVQKRYPHENQTKLRETPIDKYYDDQCRAKVREVYAEDFIVYDYLMKHGPCFYRDIVG